MEALDCTADGVGRASGVVGRAAGVVPLELGDGFKFAEGFGFDGLGFVAVEDGFEFAFFAEERAHGLGVVDGWAAFLDPGVALEG